MGHWLIDALSWDSHKSAAAFDSSPNGRERSLVQHPLQPCIVQVPLVNGTLADRCSVMGQAQVKSCIRLISQRHREITGATPLATMPRTSPVDEWDIGRSMLCHGTGTVSSCSRLISQRHGEITGATPLATMPRTRPVGEWDIGRSMLCHGTGTVSRCIRLISKWHGEITGATPLATMPRTRPVGEWDIGRSMLCHGTGTSQQLHSTHLPTA